MTNQPEALRLADALDKKSLNYPTLEMQIEYASASELRRLHEVNADLVEALQSISPYVVTQSVGCHGYKCREAWCWSCNPEEDADEAVSKALFAYQKALAALAIAAGESNEP